MKKIFLCVLTILFAVCINASAKLSDEYDWGSVALGGGGYVTGISLHNDGTVYVRTDVSGAYRLEGDRWKPLTEWVTNTQSNLFGIDGLAVASEDSKIIYAAMGKYDYSSPSGVYKSVDGGETWKYTGLGAKFSANQSDRMKGECIAVDPNCNDIIYVLTADNYMYMSTDAGQSWETVNTFPSRTLNAHGRSIVFDENSLSSGKSQIIYADIQGNGVYRSPDGGKTWHILGGDNAPTNVNRMVVDNNGNLLVAATNGLLRYENGIWNIINNYSLYDEVEFRAVDVDKDNPDRIIAVHKNGAVKSNFENIIFYTEDGGKNWRNITEKAQRNCTVPWWHSYYFSAHTADICFGENNEVWLCDWYGVWKTEDITSDETVWVNEIKGIENMVAFNLSCPPSGAPLLVGVADNSGMRVENIHTYPKDVMRNPLKAITSSIDFCESNPNIVARIGTQGDSDGKIGISTDNGKTYVEKSPCPFAGGKIAVSCQGTAEDVNIVFVPYNDGPWYSDDGGKTWQKSDFPEGHDINFVLKVWSWNQVLQADRVKKDTFYLCNPYNGNFYVSEDGGKSWTHRTTNASTYGMQIETVPGRAGHIWMCRGNGGLELSMDGGYTFTKISNVKTASYCSIGKEKPGTDIPTVYVYGTVEGVFGVYRSTDYGKSWKKISNDITALGNDVNCMKADRQTFGTVYLGTNGKSVYYGRENKIHTFFDEDRTRNFIGHLQYPYDTYSEEKSNYVSYSGDYSYRFSNAKVNIRYAGWDKTDEELNSIGDLSTDIRAEIENGTAYICGWFYADAGTKTRTVRMLYGETAQNQRTEIIKLPKEEWTFVCEKITDPDVQIGVVDTGEAGNIYIDDLCIVVSSDGKKPKPTNRVSVTIPTDAPNRYTKTLMDVYTDGFASGVYHQHAHVGSGEEVTDMVKSGEKALKITNEYYFGFMDQLQNISDELRNAINAGNAYISAWVYMGTKIDENANTDVYYPTGMKGNEGQWKWVCGQIGTGMLDDTNMLFKSVNRYTYLDDVKIVTFTDIPEGMNFDSYSVTGTESETTVNPLSAISVDAAVYNNSIKTENMTVIIAEYDADKTLVSTQVCEVNKALPFREASFSDSYTVSANSGNTVKVFMWNMADGMKNLQEVREFTIN